MLQCYSSSISRFLISLETKHETSAHCCCSTIAALVACTDLLFQLRCWSSSIGLAVITRGSPPAAVNLAKQIFSIRNVVSFPMMSEIDVIYFVLNLVFCSNSGKVVDVIPEGAYQEVIEGGRH